MGKELRQLNCSPRKREHLSAFPHRQTGGSLAEFTVQVKNDKRIAAIMTALAGQSHLNFDTLYLDIIATIVSCRQNTCLRSAQASLSAFRTGRRKTTFRQKKIFNERLPLYTIVHTARCDCPDRLLTGLGLGCIFRTVVLNIGRRWLTSTATP